MNGATPLGTRAVERLLRRQYNTQGAVGAALGVAGDLQVSVEGRAVKPEDAALFGEILFAVRVQQAAVAAQFGVFQMQADNTGQFDVVIEEISFIGDTWTVRVGGETTWGAVATAADVIPCDSYWSKGLGSAIAPGNYNCGGLTLPAPAGVTIAGFSIASQRIWNGPLIIRGGTGFAAGERSAVAVVNGTANTAMNGWFRGRLVPITVNA